MSYKYLNAEAAYELLVEYIVYCLEHNDEHSIENICNSFIYEFLTKEQQKLIDDECDKSESEIRHKLHNGELFPMNIKGENNKKTAYRLCYYYLAKNLWEKDPLQVKRVAKEVLDDMVKHNFDDKELMGRYYNFFE